MQDKSLLKSFGIIDETCTSSSDEDSDIAVHPCERIPPEFDLLPVEYFKEIVIKSNYNWFEIRARVSQFQFQFKTFKHY